MNELKEALAYVISKVSIWMAAVAVVIALGMFALMWIL